MDVKWSIAYELKSDTILKYTPISSGVYVIMVLLQNGNWKCYYVGQAMNLEQRLLSHLSSAESNNCIKEIVSKYTCKYYTAEVPRQGDRDGIELFLYQHYKPQCNDKTPPATTSITVNPPL